MVATKEFDNRDSIEEEEDAERELQEGERKHREEIQEAREREFLIRFFPSSLENVSSHLHSDF